MQEAKIDEIKQKLDILQVAKYFGIEIEKTGLNYRAKHNLMRHEKTSSLYFYQNTNKFYDFGTGVSGDCIDLIQELEKCNVKEAIQIATSLIGGTTFNITKLVPLTSITCMDNIPQENILKIRETEFNNFELLTFLDKAHHSELLAIAPIWLFKQTHEADLDLFRALTRYDCINRTLVCKCLDNTSGLDVYFLGYKRRRYKNNKWVNAMGTKINNTAFVRIFTDNSTIYLVEGYHDLLTAILLGLDFIALPFAQFKNLAYFDNYKLGNREICCICEDKIGYDGMLPIANYVAGTAKSVKLLSLSANTEKLDLSDYITRFSSKGDALKCLTAKLLI